MLLRQLAPLAIFLVAATAQAQPTLPFKSRELQEGKNYLVKLTAQLAVGEATGEVTYRYDIELPPGRGVTPTVALEYSSHAGQSEYGWGWTLTIPTIERSDENGVGASAPLEFTQPAFRFRNGSQALELLRVGSLANGWEIWRERRETTFSRYLRNPALNTWRVLHTDGTRLDLGTTDEARRGKTYSQEPTTSVWQVVTISDVHGNYAQYDYSRVEGMLTRIRYNGNNAIAAVPTMTVNLEWGYGPSGEQRVTYRPGFARYAGRKLLNAITVSVPPHASASSPALVPASSPTTRRYTFAYSTPSAVNNMFYLQRAQLESFPAVAFLYSEVGPRAGIIDKQRVFGATDASFPRDLGLSEVTPATGSPEWTRTRRVLVDVTRDGRADLLEATSDGGFTLWRNVGTSLFVKEAWNAPSLAAGTPRPEAGTLRVVEHVGGIENRTMQDFTDVTGDGFPDLAYAVSGAVFVCPGTGSGFDTCKMWHNGSPAVPYLRHESTVIADTTTTDIDLMDFNGDGRLDWFVSQGTYGLVYLNLGGGGINGHRGFDPTPLTVTMPSCAPYSVTCIRLTRMVNGVGPNRLIFIETRDVNGDSLPDYLSSSGNGQLSIYYGTGRNFESNPVVVAVPNGIGYGNQAGDGTYVTLADFVDMNGDGLVDIVNADCTSGAPLDFKVHFNNGGTWDTKPVGYSWSQNPTGGRLYETPCLSRVSPFTTADKSFVTAALADVNGDGMPDLVTADVDPGVLPSAFGYNIIVRQLPYIAPRKLLRATSLNATHAMEVTYAPLIGDLPYPVHAVTQMTRSRSPLYAFEAARNVTRTTTYEYSKPVYDESTRGFGGFASVRGIGDPHTTTTTTTFHTGPQMGGAVDSRTIISNTGNAITSFTRNEYALEIKPDGRSNFWLKAVHRFAGLGRETVTRYDGHDDYGNVTSWTEEGDPSTTADNITHKASFTVRDDTQSTQRFIKSVVYEESGNSADGGLLSTRRSYYDNSSSLGTVPVNGDLTRVERERTTGVFVASKYTYDSIGNQISSTDEMGATTTYGYDPTHRLYRVSATNAIGTIYTSYHALLASVADACGPQYSSAGGVTTYNCSRTEADVLGRVTARYVPTLSSGVYALSLLETVVYNDIAYPFLTVKTIRGTSHVYQYSDGFGRAIEQRIEIGPDQFRVFESAFDAYGAPQRVELARVEPGASYTHVAATKEAWTYDYDYVHDALTRVTQPRDPDDNGPPSSMTRAIYPDHISLYDEGGNETAYFGVFALSGDGRGGVMDGVVIAADATQPAAPSRASSLRSAPAAPLDRASARG